jgi:plastocyanin
MKTFRSGALLLLVSSAACGGGSPSPTNPNPPQNPNVITITSAGVSPSEITVQQGARVLFVNNDGRRHDMTSDEHPDHFDCPVINQVGLLLPGQQRETGNLVIVRTCGFHDHDNPTDTRLQGRIITR